MHKTLLTVTAAERIRTELRQLYPGVGPERLVMILLSFIAEQGLGEALLDLFRERPGADPAP